MLVIGGITGNVHRGCLPKHCFCPAGCIIIDNQLCKKPIPDEGHIFLSVEEIPGIKTHQIAQKLYKGTFVSVISVFYFLLFYCKMIPFITIWQESAGSFSERSSPCDSFLC